MLDDDRAVTAPSFLRRRRTWLIGVPVLVLLVAVVAPFVYIQFIHGDPPERLTFDNSQRESSEPSDAGAGAGTTTGLDGTWTVTDGSEAGYRVDEVLFGQDTEAVGRTTAVTGELTVSGTTVEAASFTVDMTKVSSDESRRDRQFHGRIMDTATHPTATFRLTEPINLGTVPADRVQVTAKATGDLTVRGTTRQVRFDLTARRNGVAIEVQGAIPVTFADFGIPDASFGPATVQDHGEVEFVLVFRRAG